MTPLHILIGLWYHTSGTGLDYEAGTAHGNSRAVAEYIQDFVTAGLLTENHGASAVRRKYESTEGLAVWIKYLTDMPFPVQKWEML